MADVTRTIHVRVHTFDPAQGRMIPVPNASLLCEDSGPVWDPDLSTTTVTTDAAGGAAVEIKYDEAKENNLNPFFTITLPAGQRTLPAGVAAERQLTLLEEWVTRHYVNRRIPRIASFTDAATPLTIFAGLHARLRVSYADFDLGGKGNPFALPEDTARVYLADYDTFFWIDFLNPDDTLTGFGFNPRTNRIVPAGEGDRYPYFDAWPTAPCALDGLPDALPHAWIDPPGEPVGTLGGGSYSHAGPLAVDGHGFVFMIDGNDIRRFYPDGTLAETIAHPFSNPGGLALDQHRRLFVADTGNNRIVFFGPDEADGQSGRYVLLGSLGPVVPGAGFSLSGPRGLAVAPRREVDAPEHLAVADTGNHAARLFSIDIGGAAPLSHRAAAGPTVTLTFVSSFGAAAAGPDRLDEPVGVAVDRDRRIFVCDRALHRVTRWRLDPAAAQPSYLHDQTWEKAGGGSGAGNREFDTPVAIAADLKSRTLYVAEAGNGRVQRLDADTGDHQANWQALPAPFVPAGVAADARGEVYAADAAGHRVVRGTTFTPAGGPLAATVAPAAVGAPWAPRAGPGHMHGPRYVTFDRDGVLWVSDTGNDRLLAFAPEADGRLARRDAPAPPVGLDGPWGIAFDGDGNLFVAEHNQNRVRMYNAALAHQRDLGSAGAGANNFSGPCGIAIAQRTEPVLYVADRDNNRVQVLRRDGTFITTLTTDGATSFAGPRDVAADGGGNVFVADTGNARIVHFRVQPDGTHRHERGMAAPRLAGFSGTPAPCGLALDPDGRLLMTDSAQDAVFLLEQDGDLLAFWDLRRIVQMRRTTGTEFYPELARMLLLASPNRAAINGHGLLAVADTQNDRVRLVRTRTEIDVNLFDLGEGLPDISFRAMTKADWSSELGLKLNVGDVSIFDDSHDVITEPEDDFARDEYEHARVLGHAEHIAEATNVMRVVRRVQQWYQHLTRQDDTGGRWGVAARTRTLEVDLIGGDNSYQILDVNLGVGSPHGVRSDAWDDPVIAHEMTHWVFFKALEPYPPFSLAGLIELSRSHDSDELTTHNLAMSEGWAEFIEGYWGSERGSIDRLRCYRLGFGDSLHDIVPRGAAAATRRHLFGGPSATTTPAFNDPNAALLNEGYFANALYQLCNALTNPGVLCADAPGYWHRFNMNVSDVQSKRFSDTIWKALRRFEIDPPMDDIDKGSLVYLRNVLRQFHQAQPDFAQLAQSIFELNNLLMPVITIVNGSDGAALPDPLALTGGGQRSLQIRVRDATGQPLRGYRLEIVVPDAARYTFPGAAPAALRGRGPAPGAPATEVYRATDGQGNVSLVVQAPAMAAGAAPITEAVTVTYQPDFDTDATFAPPERGDDRETTLRRLYLYELRAIAKTWAGTGNNFGAMVTHTQRVTISAG